jgi:hypothetical protein
MKEKLQTVISIPVLLAVGWIFTKLSERYGNALDDLYVEFDFE